MLKQAFVWILAIGVGFLGINYGLLVAALALVGVVLLAIFVAVITTRRETAQSQE
jgi:hypothetical protein